MLKALLQKYNFYVGCCATTVLIVTIVKYSPFVRKGQQQMMADYLWLELLETGRL